MDAKHYLIIIIVLLGFFTISCAQKPTGAKEFPPCDLAPGDVRITEIHKAADNQDNWIELYNASDKEIQLNRSFIIINKYRRPISSNIRLIAKSYAVLSKRKLNFASYPMTEINLGEDQGFVKLVCKDKEIDKVRYSIPSGSSMSFSIDLNSSASNLKNMNWCLQLEASPGRENPRCQIQDPNLCWDGEQQRLVQNIDAQAISISSIFVDPVGSNMNRQWFVLAIENGNSFDLNRLVIKQSFAETDETLSWKYNNNRCLNPNNDLVLLRLADYNGQRAINPTEFILSGQVLSQTNSVLAIYQNEELLDEVNYASSNEGVRQIPCENVESEFDLCDRELFVYIDNNEIVKIDIPGSKPCHNILADKNLQKLIKRSYFNNYDVDTTITLDSPVPFTISKNQLTEFLAEFEMISRIDFIQEAEENGECYLLFPGENIHIKNTDQSYG